MRTSSMPARWPATTVAAVLLALVATLLPVTATPAMADSGMESQFVAAINQERSSQGLPSLSAAGDLTAVARQHSAVMADKDDLHHNPNLGSDVGGWQKVGENVGRGASVSSLHAAFMASPGHKRNIVDPDWTQIGVGVVVVDGRVWVTEVFRLPAGAAKPKPAPAPAEPEQEAKPAPEAESTPEAEPAPADAPAQAPEPAPEPEPHEVVEQPLPLDRMTITLARLEAAERFASLEDVLTG